MTTAPVVTVDGPAGSGKSTLGTALAVTLELPLIDTGLFYRGIMVAAVRAGVDGHDLDALAALAAQTVVTVATDPRAAGHAVTVDGAPAGDLLRDPHHATLLARISSAPAVRAAVLEPQRALAVAGAVAVGRDCGTVVFPGAAVKFYLDAPQRVREQRRREQLRVLGADPGDGALADEIGGRDRADTGRVASPLRPATDAHVIDTATMGIDEMVATALATCREAGVAAPRR